MEKKFLLKVYQYVEGQLNAVIREFDRIEDAIEDGVKAACHSYKVYDENGNIHHHGQGHDHGHDHDHDHNPYC